MLSRCRSLTQVAAEMAKLGATVFTVDINPERAEIEGCVNISEGRCVEEFVEPTADVKYCGIDLKLMTSRVSQNPRHSHNSLRPCTTIIIRVPTS